MATHVVNTHQAKTRLSELIRLAERGDTVLLARNGTPVAQLTAWPPARPQRQPGGLRGQITVHDDLVGSDPDIVAMFDESSRQPLS